MWLPRLPVIVALLGVLLSGTAQAGTAPPHNIAVFGDSLADGVWAGLYQELKADPADKLYRDSKVGAGLTRPDFDDFANGFIATLAVDHITDAVVMFGANDDEGLRDDNHKGYAFQSDGWTSVYEARMTAIISACQKQGIRVFWLGLPVMRAPDRNQDAIFINGLLQQTAKAENAVFLPLEDEFKGSDGAFSLYLPDPAGKLRQVRAPDGTHFTFYGYDTIAKQVLVLIDTPPAPPQPPKAATVPPAKPAPPAAATPVAKSP
jgi:hypothetical protein